VNLNVNFNVLLSKYIDAYDGENKKDFNNIKMQGTTMKIMKRKEKGVPLPWQTSETKSSKQNTRIASTKS